jgi:hypothetical protein
MSVNLQLRSFWFAIVGVIVLMSVLPGRTELYRSIANYYSNPWVHFVAYGLVAAIPVIVSRRRSVVLLSLVFALICVAIESVHMFNPGHLTRAQYTVPNLFGVAAGILFGCNIQMLLYSPRRAFQTGSNRSSSLQVEKAASLNVSMGGRVAKR